MSEWIDARCPCGGDLIGVAQRMGGDEGVVAVCVECRTLHMLYAGKRVEVGEAGFPAAMGVMFRDRAQVLVEEARQQRAIFAGE